jgi:hypothetical protein
MGLSDIGLIILLHGIGNDAMNSSAMLATVTVAGLAQPNRAVLRQVCYTGCSIKRMGKLSSAFEKANTSVADLYGAMNLTPTLAIRFQIAKSCMMWRGISKGLSQDGGRPYFS